MSESIRAKLDELYVLPAARQRYYDALRSVLDECEFSATVECIGFDGERYIPSAAIIAAVAAALGVEVTP